MAELSRDDFAKLCGDTKAALNTYINRGKVIVHGKKGELIDTNNPVNKTHRTKREAFNKQKQSQNEMIRAIPVNPRKGKRDYDDDEEEEQSPSPEALMALFAGNKGGRPGGGGGDDGESMAQWIKMKVKGDAQLVATRVEKEKLLLAKVAGELLPTEVAFNAHRIYMQSIVTAFESGIMNIANKFCHIMAGGDMEMYTQITEECRRELDRCVKDAGGESNRELEKMIREFNGVKAIPGIKQQPIE